MKRRGFTLVELLIVIGIIALLASLLFPVIQQTKDRAYITQDAVQMRQVYVAVNLYEQSYDDESPTSLLYSEEFAKSNGVYVSPVDPYGGGVPGVPDYPADQIYRGELRSPFRISYAYLYPYGTEAGFSREWFRDRRTDPSWGLICSFMHNPTYRIQTPNQIDLVRMHPIVQRIRTDGSYQIVPLGNMWGGASMSCGVTPCFEWPLPHR